MNIYGIVLSAGKGTRMRSDKPKVIHPVLFEPMVSRIHNELGKVISKENILFILGYKADEVKGVFEGEINYVIQEQQLGTGHAVQMCKDFFKDKKGHILIISGDTPLFTQESMESLIAEAKESKSDFVVVSAVEDNPFGYGRIVVNNAGIVEKIVEQKDCSPKEAEIKLINSGIYLIDAEKLFKHIDELENNNSQEEYYLTDMLEIFNKNKYTVTNFTVENNDEIIGVNDLVALNKVNKIAKLLRNNKLLTDGVWIEDIDTVYISEDSTIEPGVQISGNVKIISSHIGAGTAIANSTIENSSIAECCNVKSAYISDSKVDKESNLGPFIHIRNNSNIGSNNRLGNFVEIKNTTIGNNTNAAHLTYLGDAEVGSRVNFGCSTVTVNYDGVNKNKTTIGDDVFVGCNTNLIAPVTIGDNTIIGAGSTITKDVPSGTMAISRVKEQKIYDNYGANFHKKVKEAKNAKK